MFLDLPLPPRKYVEIPEAFRERRVQSGRRKITIQLPPVVRQPLLLSYGLGTDSTAMLALLIKMVEWGNRDAMPDVIHFADVKAEKDITNNYVAKAQAYLKAAGFPEITVVSKFDRGTSKDNSIIENCERLKTLPSICYGGKSCSIKHKADQMDLWTNKWLPAQQAWAAGMTVLKLIGYDAGKADMRRSTNPGDEKYTYCYPLRDAGLTRPDLTAIIAAMGWDDPGKSACFMCGATKRHEIVPLYHSEPDKLARSLRLEAAAMRHSIERGMKMTTKGLGRNWSWRELLETTAPEIIIDLAARYGIGTEDWLIYKDLMSQRRDLAPGPLTEPEVETCDGAFDEILAPIP
jgi:hypothetical protein